MILPTNSLLSAIRLCEVNAAMTSSSVNTSWRVSVGMKDTLTQWGL